MKQRSLTPTPPAFSITNGLLPGLRITAGRSLVVLFLLCLCPLARAQFEITIEGLVVTLTAYTGTGPEVVVPDGVTHIGSEAFFGCSELAEMTLPPNLRYIETRAFEGCSGLTTISIPENVIKIGYAAFKGCENLLHAAIPDSVTTLGGFFPECSALRTATIGTGIDAIGREALADLPALRAVYFEGNHTFLDYIHGREMFKGSENVVVYRYPGATGWKDTFHQRPVIVWNPHISSVERGVEGQDGLSITIAGNPGLEVIVDVCFDLNNPAWTEWAAFSLLAAAESNGESAEAQTPVIQLEDSDWIETSPRFYCFRHPQ